MSDPGPSTRRRILSAEELTGVRSFPMPRLREDGGRAWLSEGELAERIRRARTDGEAAGYTRGLQEGLQRGRAEGSALTEERLREERRREVEELGADYAERLDALYESAQAEMARIEVRAADEFAAFCVALAGRIVQHTVAVDPDVIVSVVQAGLERIGELPGEIVCRLNPGDLDAVKQAFGGENDRIESLRLRVSPDLGRGGCVLETPDIRLDLTLEARWRQAMADLGRNEAGHTQDTPDDHD